MKYFVDSQFERLYKKLGFQQQEQIKRAISELLAFFDSGVKTEGLGLKKTEKRLLGNPLNLKRKNSFFAAR